MSGTKRRNTGRSAPGCRRNARRYRPRASTSSPASAAVAGAPLAPLRRDDRAGKAPGASCRSASPHGRSCPPPQASRSASEALAVMADRQPGEAPVGADSPGRLETIDIRHLHVHQHRVERHARLQHLLNAPARRRRGPPGRPRCSTARRRPRRFSALSSTTSRRTPRNRWVRSTGAAAGLAGAPCSACNACSTESASCLGVTGLVRKSTKGGALWSRASASTAAIGGDHDHHGRRQVACNWRISCAAPRPSRSGMRQSISTTS